VITEVDVRARAEEHRRALGNVVAVAVTGSCGKTTTTDLIAAVLSSRYRGTKSDGTWNCGLGVAHSLLSVQRDDDFFVQELGAWGPGTLDGAIQLVRPDIAVITNFRNDHYSGFHGARGAQAEKGKLVAALDPGGTAVLNCDDPLVGELAARTWARTLCFGCGPRADLRAWDVSASWPGRLTFSVSYGNHHRRVWTRLLGQHLLGSALAALGVGLVFGMTLDEAASALESAEPTFRRMSPVPLPDGITFIRDDYKATADSMPEVFLFMADAVAARKLAVVGRISDYPGRSRRCYTHAARLALAALDVVVFVGQRAAELWGEHWGTSAPDQVAVHERLERTSAKAAAGSRESLAARGTMLVFEKVKDASGFLADFLRSGDLVLLKGSGQADHLERVLLSRQRRVNCWLPACGKKEPCDTCSLVEVPAG
jgi:UDP-N-acetylmuramoyl-tripeptide--D-alanyl-D-alanine ligase